MATIGIMDTPRAMETMETMETMDTIATTTTIINTHPTTIAATTTKITKTEDTIKATVAHINIRDTVMAITTIITIIMLSQVILKVIPMVSIMTPMEIPSSGQRITGSICFAMESDAREEDKAGISDIDYL